MSAEGRAPMRFAVISDIHGNRLAFDAVLDDLAGDGIDQIVCLGDAIQGGPQPAETVARLRELGCPVVLGNADEYLLNGPSDGEGETALQADTRAWSLTFLNTADRAFISSFQPTVRVTLGGAGDLLAFHGSPFSYNDIIFPDTPDDEVARLLGPLEPALFAGGHTHLQQLRRLNGARFINPGSVGLAYDPRQERAIPRADPWAEYAVITAGSGGRIDIEFRRVPYDTAALVRIGREAGIPHFEEWSARYRG
ncbi:MAG: metallophosphoesterase [Chloroflexi bacterium]|nr:MAG: metallophosphoesterase [Chloroflexota bacterium]